MFGRRWEELLGYDVLSRVVVRIDYEHQTVTMYDPAAFVASAGAIEDFATGLVYGPETIENEVETTEKGPNHRIPVFNLGLLFVGSAILKVRHMNSVANPKFFQSRVARSEV